MNQQRTRRFRAAKESVEMANLKAEKKAEIERNGGRLPPPDPKVEKFDSNCITPGTGFMNRLADALRYYVSARLNDSKGIVWLLYARLPQCNSSFKINLDNTSKKAGRI